MQVIIAFVSAALLTFGTSILCGCLKFINAFWGDDTEDSKANAETHRQVPAGSTYGSVVQLLRNSGNLNFRVILRMSHYILSRTLLGLGMNQLVAGFAMYISTLIQYVNSCSRIAGYIATFQKFSLIDIHRYGARSRDPHAALGFALASLSMFSQLQVTIVQQRLVDVGVFIRSSAFLVYVLALLITTCVGFNATHGVVDLVGACLGFGFGTAFVFQAFSDILTISFFGYMGHEAMGAMYSLVPILAGVAISSLFTMWYLVRSLMLKFDDEAAHGCNLNAAEENEWTLGQMFAVIMLVALLLPAVDASLGAFC